MKLHDGMFAIKLNELEKQYGRLQSRLRICLKENHKKIRQELQKAMDEYKESDLLLQESVKGCRSPAVAALSGAQLDYFQTAEELLEQKLPDYLKSEAATSGESESEAAALYAEYAIDFAVRSMNYALIAALKAIDTQMNTEEKEDEEDA